MKINAENIMKFFRLDGPIDAPLKFLSIEDGGNGFSRDYFEKLNEISAISNSLKGTISENSHFFEEGEVYIHQWMLHSGVPLNNEQVKDRKKSILDRNCSYLSMAFQKFSDHRFSKNWLDGERNISQQEHSRFLSTDFQGKFDCNLKLRPIGRPKESYWDQDLVQLMGYLDAKTYIEECFRKRGDLIQKITDIAFDFKFTKAIIGIGSFKAWKKFLNHTLSFDEDPKEEIDYSTFLETMDFSKSFVMRLNVKDKKTNIRLSYFKNEEGVPIFSLSSMYRGISYAEIERAAFIINQLVKTKL